VLVLVLSLRLKPQVYSCFAWYLQRVRTTEGVPLAWHLHGINLQYVGSKAVSFALYSLALYLQHLGKKKQLLTSAYFCGVCNAASWN
jgi:hypothetical protein